MERAIGDRLAVVLVALAQAARPLELTGSLGAESVGDYVRVFDYTQGACSVI